MSLKYDFILDHLLYLPMNSVRFTTQGNSNM